MITDGPRSGHGAFCALWRFCQFFLNYFRAPPAEPLPSKGQPISPQGWRPISQEKSAQTGSQCAFRDAVAAASVFAHTNQPSVPVRLALQTFAHTAERYLCVLARKQLLSENPRPPKAMIKPRVPVRFPTPFCESYRPHTR